MSAIDVEAVIEGVGAHFEAQGLELEGPAPDDRRDVAAHPQAPDEILPAATLDAALAKLGDLASYLDLPRLGGPGGDECGRPSARPWTRSVAPSFGSYIRPVPSPAETSKRIQRSRSHPNG